MFRNFFYDTITTFFYLYCSVFVSKYIFLFRPDFLAKFTEELSKQFILVFSVRNGWEACPDGLAGVSERCRAEHSCQIKKVAMRRSLFGSRFIPHLSHFQMAFPLQCEEIFAWRCCVRYANSFILFRHKCSSFLYVCRIYCRNSEYSARYICRFMFQFELIWFGVFLGMAYGVLGGVEAINGL